MRRWSAWGVATFVAMVLPSGVYGQDLTTSRGGWFTNLFGLTGRREEPKELPEEVKPELSPAQRRALAKRKWLRRLEVCDKLRQIAMESGDEELANKADRLDRRAWEIYSKQTGTASVPSAPAVASDVNRIRDYLERTSGGQQSAEARLRFDERRQMQTASGGD